MPSKCEQIWDSLQDAEYRREFAGDVGTGLAFQIRMLREKKGWTQDELAQRTGKRQETISLWENPNYGNYTLKTLKCLAGAFDVVPVFRLGAFSDLVEWNVNLSPQRLTPPSFDEEYQQAQKLGWTFGTGTTIGPLAGVDGAGVTITFNVAGTSPFFVTPHAAGAADSAGTPNKKEPNCALAA